MEDASEWVNSIKSAHEYSMSISLLCSEWKKNNLIKMLFKTDSIDHLLSQDTPLSSHINQSLEEEGQSILGTEIEDLSGTKLVDTIVGNKLVLFVLFRQYGCVSSRQFASKWYQFGEILEELGVQLVGIGCGSVEGTAKFKKDFSFPGMLLTDKNKALYKMIGCRHGIKYALSLKGMGYCKKLFSEGIKPASTDGDPLQLGGAFLFSRHTGIIYRHLDTSIESKLNFSDVTNIIWAYQRDYPDMTWATPPNLDLGIFSTSNSANESLEGRTYHLERGYKHSVKNYNRLLDFELYQKMVCDNQDCDIWVRKLPADYSLDSDEIGPVIVVLSIENNNDRAALVLHKGGTTPRYIYSSRGTSDKDYAKYACVKIFKKDFSLVRVNPSSIHDDLLDYESKSIFYREFKFGVLLAKDGDVTEDDLYRQKQPTEDFKELLNTLGTVVPLKDKIGYLGGLDNVADRTGTHSVCTEYCNNTIMFHVATMIPSDDTETSISQKRHIGNDVVVIIFQEGDAKINFADFRSQFNHVFAIVKKEQVESRKSRSYKYRVQFVYKPDVPPSPPFLQDPPLYDIGKSFREFFLSKLINLERMITMSVPTFKSKMSKVRDDILLNIVTKSLKKENRKESASTKNSPRSHYSESPPSSFKKLKKEPSSGESSPMKFKLVNHGISEATNRSQPSPTHRRKAGRSHSDKTETKSEIRGEDPRRHVSEKHMDPFVQISNAIDESPKLSRNSKDSFNELIAKWKKLVSPQQGHQVKPKYSGKSKGKAPVFKRIIVIDKFADENRDIIPITIDDSLETVLEKVSNEMGKPIERLEFSGVILKPKHIPLLKDCDELYVTFKNQ